MYEIKEDSIKDLENVFSLLNELETKGIQNHNIISNIAALLQKIRQNIVEVDDKVKTSNLPITKKEEG